MTIKQVLKVSGTLLFLFAIFGYLFPEWGRTEFSNNENLFRLIIAGLLVLAAELSVKWRRVTLAIVTLAFLALGIYGFTRYLPADVVIRTLTIPAHLDKFDNYLHVLLGLFFGWFAIHSLNRSSR